MKILYIIALLSFAALVWAAFAITRHIRKNATANRAATHEPDLSQALEARLTDISRSAPETRTQPPQTPASEDFSHPNQSYPSQDRPSQPRPDKSPIRSETRPAPDHS